MATEAHRFRATSEAFLVGVLVLAGSAACARSNPTESGPIGSVSTADATTVGPLYCPSLDQVREHWKQYGEELKPSPDCPDPDPLPDPTGAPEPPGAPAEEPKTFSQAQELLDPEDDPLVLINQERDGTFSSILIAVADKMWIPPASVQTTQQYEAWVAAEREQTK